MDPKLKRIYQEDRRLVFLKLLADAPDYAHNEFVLKDALAAMGHHVSSDRLRNEAAWLEEQGLITVKEPAGLTVYKITPRGKDAALGLAKVPGVKTPEPGLDY